MSRTIKQLSEELGVSKTAIRKRFTDDFKAQYVETNPDGSLRVSDDGCKLIEESLRKLPQTAQTKFAETGENQSLRETDNANRETNIALIEQLSSKDEQALRDRRDGGRPHRPVAYRGQDYDGELPNAM